MVSSTAARADSANSANIVDWLIIKRSSRPTWRKTEPDEESGRRFPEPGGEFSQATVVTHVIILTQPEQPVAGDHHPEPIRKVTGELGGEDLPIGCWGQRENSVRSFAACDCGRKAAAVVPHVTV